jgi:DNA-binding response OmpR family regulator
MRMPEMDGATFLAHVEKRSPDSTRILLTGYSDIQAAIRAVNEGHIFRFLAKPCGPDVLRQAARAAVEQYRLIHAEREILEKTLAGSIRALTQILEIVNPAAFGRAARIRRYVTHMAKAMGLADQWQYEVAANLSQIGCVTLSEDTIDRQYAGQELEQVEAEHFAAHPHLAGKLLGQIPRLEAIAEMIAHQASDPKREVPDGPSRQGGELLRAALTLDRLIAQGRSQDRAIHKLGDASFGFSAAILGALASLPIVESSFVVRRIGTNELNVGMTILEDLRDTSGILFAASGHQITALTLSRLRSLARDHRIKEPFLVQLGEPS